MNKLVAYRAIAIGLLLTAITTAEGKKPNFPYPDGMPIVYDVPNNLIAYRMCQDNGLAIQNLVITLLESQGAEQKDIDTAKMFQPYFCVQNATNKTWDYCALNSATIAACFEQSFASYRYLTEDAELTANGMLVYMSLLIFVVGAGLGLRNTIR